MATAFALSIFSTLLLHSYQRVVQIIVSAVNTKHKDSKGAAEVDSCEAEIADSLQHGKSIVRIMLDHGISVVVSDPATARQDSKTGGVKPAAVLEGSPIKQKKRRVVDRRRTCRTGVEQGMLISEEEEESGSDGDLDGSIGDSSDGSLSVLSDDLEEEDNLELLDSLSDSSEDEKVKEPVLNKTAEVAPDKGASATGLAPSPGKKTGRRQIILAANFNMPPASAPQKSGGTTSDKADRPPSPAPPSFKEDKQLKELLKSTAVQTSVYTACTLVAEESSLMALRVLVYWLQSYPIIIATCTQVRFCGNRASF